MTSIDIVPDKIPLSVLLFHAAMLKSKSISDFASDLGVGPISLRQFILGNTQRPRQKTLDLISDTLNLPPDEVRRRMDLLPEAAPHFGEWLQNAMQGRFSRAKLTRETKISDGALRNYLSGQTLPDSEQAQRLAEVLEVPTLDLAQMIVANQVAQNGGAIAQPSDSPPAADTAAADAPITIAPVSAEALAAPAPRAAPVADEDHLLTLWRRLHPQGRRATLQYIAALLAEG
jgi:transcriptional regulator with XRE-family HTH domain